MSINLKQYLTDNEPIKPEDSVAESVAEKVAFEAISMDMNEILGEWSYKIGRAHV